MHSSVFKVVDLISPNLMFRSDADLLLDTVTKDDPESVDIDFSGIESITGTFAHQYLKRRNSSPVKIVETNMPDNIRKMMEAVQHKSTSPRFENVVCERHTTFL